MILPCFHKKKFHLDINRLDRLKITGLSSWAQLQIESDFSVFQKKRFKKQEVHDAYVYLKTLFDVNELQIFHCSITNNVLKIHNIKPNDNNLRIKKFITFFGILLKMFNVPDIDFLYGTHDYYDLKLLNIDIQIPIFCISKKIGDEKIITFPHVEWLGYNDCLLKRIVKKSKELPFNKRSSKIFWRGSNTGSFKDNPRLSLIKFAEQYPTIFDVGITSIVQDNIRQNGIFTEETLCKKDMKPYDQIEYKYLVAIDGFSFPGSFFWQLFSGSLIIKRKSDFIEWYYPGIIPGVHYLEYIVEDDLLSLFEYAEKNPELITTIVKNSESYATNHLSNEYMLYYSYILLLRYSNIFS